MIADRRALDETLDNARRALLAARCPAGHWQGELSSSALSTATAVFALWKHRTSGPDEGPDPRIKAGLDWLASHQNTDGGFGDTIKSLSNISTTALCWAAFCASAGDDADYLSVVERAQAWLIAHAGGVDPAHLVPAIVNRYGKDRTFSVPILTMCALAGRLGEGPSAWRGIPQLPFELAAFPQRWFKWLRLPVVSYALPALIAMGVVRDRQCPTSNPLAWCARRLAHNRALRLLEWIQPASGGFLEATPLTSFVVMSLIGAGLGAHPVVQRGVEFLRGAARPDGSWPIDTNLGTWVTTLAVNALALDPRFEQEVPAGDRTAIGQWLLGQQFRAEHPYTLSSPGAWAWTDLSGGVPDADDTAGALLALKNLGTVTEPTRRAARQGIRWLLALQNRDGGIPTFCRGWGKLPFDRSSPDLTAHAIRAWLAWRDELDSSVPVARGIARALHYLLGSQRPSGCWSPLWFGNQWAPEEENLTYGTSRVLKALAGIQACSRERDGEGEAPAEPRLGRSLALPYDYGQKGSVDLQRAGDAAVRWLIESQNPDGGWGGAPGTPSTIEETALAVEALAGLADRYDSARSGLGRGLLWLIDRTDRGRVFDPAPIGFYFAKLWYYETLYPLIFTVAALSAAKRLATP